MSYAGRSISTARFSALIGSAALFFVVFFLSGCGIVNEEVKFPKPTGYVNDYANVLTPDQRNELDATLKNFEAQTSNEIVIAIVPTFQGLDSFTYSQELFDTWKVGKQKKDNGVLFVIGPKLDLPFPQRGDAFINVGKGLEGAMPDSVTGSILRNEVFPQFKDQHFFEGVQAGINAMMSATRGEYKADASSTKDVNTISELWPGLFWFGIFFVSWIGAFLGRSKSWWLGGVIGGIISFIVGLIFFTGLGVLLVTIFGSGAGLLFDFIVSKNYKQRKAAGKPTDFWHSGGGFWFGGGRGGFGGGGGGFGGFGGGGSGGGGAGGGW